LLEIIAPVITIAHQEIFVTASIGASFCPRDADNADDLLRNADVAMYAVKERGRKGFRFYSDELNENAAKKLRLRTEIANALEKEEFELYYQPKVDSRTGLIVGCESLIRWNHPDLGLVNPGSFITEIERSGAIIEVGRWSLRAAAHQLTQWHKQGFDTLSMSTNVSPRQFSDRNFLASVEEVLSDTAVTPQLFELEITESAVFSEIEHALTIMGQLRALGLQLCIDDFGTGYSSLQYLQRMPIGILKIDKSFVQEIGINARGESVADAIIALGRSLEQTIVAEGVETKEQLDYLTAQSCHIIQGYYYSRPLPAPEFEKLLNMGLLRTTDSPRMRTTASIALVS
jgi:EAL domain-containing protein (putative c-di-GMP-specific phosphodiesterase class I)